MAIFKLNVNGKKQQVDVDPATPMLWVLRDHLNLVGTKYGCGIAQCGACTIHLGNTLFHARFKQPRNAHHLSEFLMRRVSIEF